ncbi:MAG: DUF6049 family protein [Dermatophilaceae bacterium]
MVARRPRRALAPAVGLVSAVIVGLAPSGPATGATPAASLPTTASATPPVTALTIRIDSITPTIARAGNEVVVQGVIVNPTSQSLAGPLVTLRGSIRGLTNRDDVRSWASGGPIDRVLTTWDARRLSGDLAPGASREFVLRKRLPSQMGSGYGALPVELTIAGARVPTFVVSSGSGVYPPLAESVVLPVTLRPDRSLFGPYGASRRRAWLAEVGDEGRLTRLLAAGKGLPVVWAVDPTLLDAPDAIAPERPLDPAGGAAWDRIGPDQKAEVAARRAFRDTLLQSLAGSGCLILPVADADLVAGLRMPSATARLRDLVAGADAARSAAAAQCRTDILWPADGLVSTQRGRELAAYAPGGHVGALLGRVGSTPAADGTRGAIWQTADGVPVLAYDDALSNALIDLDEDETGIVTGQRLLADSLALFLQAPSIERQVLVSVPRAMAFTGTGLRTALNRWSAAPWGTGATLSGLLAAVPSAPQVADRTPVSIGLYAGIPTDPSTSTTAALTAGRLTYLQRALEAVETTAKVRVDGVEQVALWSQSLTQLFSSRWRADPTSFQGAMRRLREAGTAAEQAVAVTPETINFFADTGRLQITVTNNLDVGLTDLGVRLDPLSGWLRFDDQPPPVDIGPHSKAVVVVRATALAAGSVPIRARLTAPDGSEVASETTVTVRVRPTGDWIYYAMGGVAAILLVLGVWRTRRSRRLSPPPVAPPRVAS